MEVLFVSLDGKREHSKLLLFDFELFPRGNVKLILCEVVRRRQPYELDLLRLGRVFAFPQAHEAARQIVLDAQKAAAIVKVTSVLGRRENRHKFFVRKEFVTIVDDEVPAANQVDVVFLAKILHDLFVEGEADAAFTVPPLLLVLAGVTPE